MKTIDFIANEMPIMKYYNNEKDCQKRTDMIENKDNLYIASEKHDGDFGLFAHYEKGHNLIRSRSISTVTGKFGDYTEKLPHLCEEMDNWPDNTVILAEICWDKYGTNANTVGTILRCLPAKAVERQKEQKLSGLVFDMLMYDGNDLVDKPYIDRLELIDKVKSDLFKNFFKPTAVFESDFQEHADEIIRAGGEGVVIQRKDNAYLYGTRTAWKTLKLKQKMDSAEYPVIGVLEPTRMYDGICRETWKYWAVGHFDIDGFLTESLIETEGGQPYLDNRMEGTCPVTKPYFYGWKNGVTILLPSGIKTDVASGLTDGDREWLATMEAAKAIKNGDLYAEVAAMSINDLGKLRHPYVVRLRRKEDGANE